MEVIHEYAIDGKLEKLKDCVECYKDINCVDYDSGDSTLAYASMSGHLHVVEYLVEKGVEIDCSNHDGWTPLIHACREGYLDVVKYLVEKGADVNCIDYSSYSPLFHACREGHLPVVEYLVENTKVHLDRVDIVGHTALFVAIFYGHLEISKYLIDNGLKDDNAITTCIRVHNREILHYLLTSGINVNEIDDRGYTGLLVAACNDNFEFVKILVENGADVNFTTNSGYTALHFACANGNLEMTKYLLENKSLKIINATMFDNSRFNIVFITRI